MVLFLSALDDWVLLAQLCIHTYKTPTMCLISFCIIQIKETEDSKAVKSRDVIS